MQRFAAMFGGGLAQLGNALQVGRGEIVDQRANDLDRLQSSDRKQELAQGLLLGIRHRQAVGERGEVIRQPVQFEGLAEFGQPLLFAGRSLRLARRRLPVGLRFWILGGRLIVGGGIRRIRCGCAPRVVVCRGAGIPGRGRLRIVLRNGAIDRDQAEQRQSQQRGSQPPRRLRPAPSSIAGPRISAVRRLDSHRLAPSYCFVAALGLLLAWLRRVVCPRLFAVGICV